MMRHLRAFALGIREFRSDWTTSVDDEVVETYDRGRSLAHRLTMRKWDGAR